VTSNNLSKDSNITSKTYHGGKARGRLYGGNLSTFLSMLQSKYFPRDFKWSEVILFLEDVDEVPYHIDRMLIELEFQGVFASVAGNSFKNNMLLQNSCRPHVAFELPAFCLVALFCQC
jgi:muramoyltetrapeptide carboxypeptidase LdcA involved in peptidoglycan recycling